MAGAASLLSCLAKRCAADQLKRSSFTSLDDLKTRALQFIEYFNRGILTALAWLGLPQRGFALHDVRSAADYLGLSSEELRRASEELARLRFELGYYEPTHAANS